MDLYRVPPIVIINFKRFKQQKQQMSGYYSFGAMMGGGVGQKNDAQVEFPLEGLDLSQHVKGSQKDESLIYDCYAVSNHFGSIGFGHYTAFAKNPYTDKWYEFDDSSVHEIGQGDL